MRAGIVARATARIVASAKLGKRERWTVLNNTQVASRRCTPPPCPKSALTWDPRRQHGPATRLQRPLGSRPALAHHHPLPAARRDEKDDFRFAALGGCAKTR